MSVKWLHDDRCNYASLSINDDACMLLIAVDWCWLLLIGDAARTLTGLYITVKLRHTTLKTLRNCYVFAEGLGHHTTYWCMISIEQPLETTACMQQIYHSGRCTITTIVGKSVAS